MDEWMMSNSLHNTYRFHAPANFSHFAWHATAAIMKEESRCCDFYCVTRRAVNLGCLPMVKIVVFTRTRRQDFRMGAIFCSQLSALTSSNRFFVHFRPRRPSCHSPKRTTICLPFVMAFEYIIESQKQMFFDEGPSGASQQQQQQLQLYSQVWPMLLCQHSASSHVHHDHSASNKQNVSILR